MCLLTYQFDQLRQPQPQLDQDRVSVVADWPYQAIVVAQKVIVEPLGVRIPKDTVRNST